jgi:hypothetical protein
MMKNLKYNIYNVISIQTHLKYFKPEVPNKFLEETRGTLEVL